MRIEYEVPLIVQYIHEGINRSHRDDKKIKALWLSHDEWTVFTNWMFENNPHMDAIFDGRFFYRGVEIRYDSNEGESDAA